MDKKTEALKLALEALESVYGKGKRCEAAITALRRALEQPAQPNEADDLLRRLGLDPERFRTDGGYINHMKVRAAIQHPDEYAAAMQPMYRKLANCVFCGRLNPKEGECDHGGEVSPQARDPLTDEQEREAFEVWCYSVGLMQKSHGIVSINSQADTAWMAWQARAAHGITGEKK